ncbi:MAG TPA: SusC/RagA family TonB-linked outer membrane protein [Gemmatimonadaceae bacterium]|nr:SusC/RagA family TonB-linked outer membrane protein [Gemmatimonadaceae bacterium]
MRIPPYGPLLRSAAAILLLAVPTIEAQQAVITGRVTSEQGEPLGGASVAIVNTNFGAGTTATGTYTLTVPTEAVRGQAVVLTARRIGFRPANRTITLQPGNQQVDFQLASDPLRLEEVVVTGVGEATARDKLAFAAASIGPEMQAVPGGSALVGLQGKVAAVRLTPTSAQPGGEVAIRLRGATSISGRQDPLYIVDGVITEFGMADIAPEDIERVEIIKGAAASSLYGSNAANGVVQVFTKRGRSLPDGTLRVTSRLEGGLNNMPKKMEFSRSHAWMLEQSAGFCAAQGQALEEPETWTVDPVGNYCLNETGARVTEPDQIADNPFSIYRNHWDEVVDEGQFWTGYVSVGQRRGTTNFSASVQNTRNQGVIFGLGGYTRQNFRLNLDQQIRPNVDASFSAFYGTSTNGRTEEGQGGPFFGLMFLQPDVDITAPNDDGTPYRATVPLSGDVANDFNPLYELANRKIDQDRNRFSGSGRARWRILDWLSAEGSFAYDQEAQYFSDVIPFGYLTSSGDDLEGSLVKESRNNWQYNTGITLSSVRRFWEITNTTKVGVSYEDQMNRILADTAGSLVVARVPEFGGANRGTVRVGSREEKIKNQNYLALTTFDIKDRYILDALIRRDGSSLFGPESRWTTYYRVSGAWRVTEDFTIPGLDEFRLRSSYGTAGLRPQYDDQYEILTVTPGGFTKEILGNPLLKPARSAELEVGTNLEFGGGRYSVEYTFARKNTRDQILLVDLPAVAGFKQQWQNTGALESKTHELTFATQLINTASTSLTLNIVGDRTRQVITEWNLPERLYSFQQMPSAFFLGAGSNLGVLYGNRWVRNIEELYDDPDKAAQSAPGQAWHRDNLMINEDGYVILKSTHGTPNERAIKYTYCKIPDTAGGCAVTSQIVQIGDANPDFNLSFSTTLNHRRFVVTGLLDWSQGGDLYNGTRQWAFQATRDRIQDQAGKPEEAKKSAAYYAVGFYNGLDPNDFFVEDGSYVKLKELSVGYTFVNDQLRRIGLRGAQDLRVALIGRNLFTITDYSGLDPEVSGLFGDPFQVKMDWFQYPQFRTYSAVVEITF